MQAYEHVSASVSFRATGAESQCDLNLLFSFSVELSPIDLLCVLTEMAFHIQ
jgi:hypothetical protein